MGAPAGRAGVGSGRGLNRTAPIRLGKATGGERPGHGKSFVGRDERLPPHLGRSLGTRLLPIPEQGDLGDATARIGSGLRRLKSDLGSLAAGLGEDRDARRAFARPGG